MKGMVSIQVENLEKAKKKKKKKIGGDVNTKREERDQMGMQVMGIL